MTKIVKGGPKSKGMAETKGGKYIKYNPSTCTKTITDLKTDKSIKVKMSRAECKAKGGNEEPITRTPKEEAQRKSYTARALRIKNEQEGN